ncbi:MAG: DUF932 domain-containing protein [Symploca sp. SIO2G7]|nr:DUF932 domain-containing protein [Symploca sp. SIO2G7]
MQLTEEAKLFRGLGSAISPGMSQQEILEKSGLNWSVTTVPFEYETPTGRMKSSHASTLAAFRSDTGKLLTVVGNSWKPYQNYQLLEDFWLFCEQVGLNPDWAGFVSRKPNSRSHIASNMAFISAKIPKEQGGIYHLSADEVLNSRIIFFNHHTYGYGAGSYLLTCRQICSNGMTITVKENNSLIRHIQNQIGDQEKILQSLNNVKRAFNKYTDDMEALADFPMSPEEALAVLIKEFGYVGQPLNKQPKVVQTCLELFLGHFDDQMEEKGLNLGTTTLAAYRTAYGLLQSVTAYRNHMSGTGSNTNHVLSLLNGTAAKSSCQVYSSLVKLARLPKSTTVPVSLRGL